MRSGSKGAKHSNELTSSPIDSDTQALDVKVCNVISASLDASGMAQDATLTGGAQKAIARGGVKGATAAADITSTTVDVNTQALDVSIKGTVPVSVPGVIPVSDNGGSLTVDGAVTVSGTVAVSGTVPVSAAALPLPTGAAQEHVTAASPSSHRLSDGSAFYDATKTGQLPSALVGSRLDINNGAWLGSTAPSVGQKAMASSLPVTIASDQSAVPVSGTVAVSGTVPVSDGGGSLTVDGTVGISGTVPVSIAAALPVTDNAGSLTVDGTVAVSSVAGTVAVSIAAALPITDNAGSLTVDGTVAVSSVAGTVAVSAAALPLPSGAAQEHTAAATPNSARLSDGSAFYDATKTGQLPSALVGSRLDTNVGSWMGSTAPSVGQKAAASAIPVVLASDQGSIGKTNVLKTGTLTTSATTADQVVLTYTVTALKTFFLQYLHLCGSLTAISATASILGTMSLETPSGTKVFTTRFTNPTISLPDELVLDFQEAIPVAAGVVVRVVVTPAAATGMTWIANFGGYEKS